MSGALIRRTWAIMTWGLIVGLGLALVAARPAQAARWAMIDGIGPRPALDYEDGVSFCLDGMQIGVALPEAGTIHLVVDTGGIPLFEGDLTVDLPIDIGPVTHSEGDTYNYSVSDRFMIPWNRVLNLPTRVTLRFGPNREWFIPVQIASCYMRSSTPTAEIVQVGPGSTSPTATGGLVFAATARDTAAGQSNGAGLYATDMQIKDADGLVVGRHVFDDTFGPPSYCIFEVFAPCANWVFADRNYLWPNTLPIRSGPHKLVVVAHTMLGARLTITKDIQIDAHQAKSYRTTAPPLIDGNLAEWGGQGVPLTSILTTTRLGLPASAANASATVRSMWTASHLYFAVSVTDNEIWNDGPNPWHDDEIEIGIDGLRDGIGTGVDDHQYTANPDGRQTDQGVATTAFQLKTRTRPDGWDAEFAIPVGQMKAGAFIAGKVFGFNLSLRDDDDGSNGDRQQVWTGTTTYRVEPTWGTLTLVDTAAPTGPAQVTSVPAGDTITLQAGQNGYTGVRDTYINAAANNVNTGSAVTLKLQDKNSPNALSSLLRFDLSAVPADAQVFRATLSLRAIQRSHPENIYAEVRRVKKDWPETQATWLNARAGVPWQEPGAMGANDVAGYITGQNIWAVDGWYSFDVTLLVQGWMAGTWPNHGLLLRVNVNKPVPQVTYDFASSNMVYSPGGGVEEAYRPELIVSYWGSNQGYLPFVSK